MNFDVNTMIAGAVGTAGTGLIAWAGLAIRKIFKNLGRTEVDIKVADYEKALKALEAAHATGDKADDLSAEAQVELTKRKLDLAKRLEAITDGLSTDKDPQS